MKPYYERGGIKIYVGDNRWVIPLIDERVHAVVTDPPYGLEFMGKEWDKGVPGIHFWEVIASAMLPGAHLLAFGGTRTYHRMAVAIEDAGYEIRDTLQWLYGSGFPKSHDVSKAIDKLDAVDARQQRRFRFTEWMRSTGLTPKRINELTSTDMGHHYTTHPTQPAVATSDHFEVLRPHITVDVPQWVEQMVDERTVESENFKRREVIGKSENGIAGGSKKHAGQEGAWGFNAEHNITAPATPEAEQWQGWGTALKPAYEPIIMARLPFKGTVAANVLEHGTGAINVDASRIGTDTVGWQGARGGSDDPTQSRGRNYRLGEGEPRPVTGRWPSNVILDEAAAEALDAQSGVIKSGARKRERIALANRSDTYSGFDGCSGKVNAPDHYGDTGGASRFFYVAKASRRERNAGLEGMPERFTATMNNGIGAREHGPANPRAYTANSHPTVKPLALMRYLIQMVTPPGGTVLDPFAGSGSTLVAAAELGFDAVGIELSEEYAEIAARRVDHALNERAKRLPGMKTVS